MLKGGSVGSMVGCTDGGDDRADFMLVLEGDTHGELNCRDILGA